MGHKLFSQGTEVSVTIFFIKNVLYHASEKPQPRTHPILINLAITTLLPILDSSAGNAIKKQKNTKRTSLRKKAQLSTYTKLRPRLAYNVKEN